MSHVSEYDVENKFIDRLEVLATISLRWILMTMY